MRWFLFALPLFVFGCASGCSSKEDKPKEEPTESEGIDFRNHQDSLKYVQIEAVKVETIRPSLNLPGKITFDDHGQNTVPAITRYVVQDAKWLTWEESEYAGGKRKLVGK